ncbi:MAG: hypothetical protein K6F09_07245 [Clostridiales bacterium]|nr:hypothetical protein [Clostridiales bacterium]
MKEFERPNRSIPKDKRFCPHCGEIKNKKSFTDDSEYCSDCKKAMLKTRVKWPVIFVFILFAAFSAFAAFLAVKCYIPVSSLTVKSEKLKGEKRLYEAYDKYDEINDMMAKYDDVVSNRLGTKLRWLGPGAKTLGSFVKIESEMESYSDAGAMIKSMISENVRSGYYYNKYFAPYVEANDDFYKLDSLFNDYVQSTGVSDASDLSFNDAVEFIDSKTGKDASAHKKCYAEYLKASVAYYVMPDNAEVVQEYLNKMYEYAPDEYLKYLDLSFWACKKTGDYKKFYQVCDDVVKNNVNNKSVYEFKMDALLNEEKYDDALSVCTEFEKYNKNTPDYFKYMMKINTRKGDIDEAYKYVDAAEKANIDRYGDIFTDVLAQKSISKNDELFFKEQLQCTMWMGALMLLKDRVDDAYDYIGEYCYSFAYYYDYVAGTTSCMNQSVIDISVLCGTLAKDDEFVKNVKSSGEPSQAIQDCLDGKITLEDLFVKGRAETL